MPRRSLAATLAALAFASAPAAAQQVLFHDDFEAGLGNWTASVSWQVQDDASNCFQHILPFPSGNQVAYFGNPVSCTFFDAAWPGNLDMNVGVDLPATAQSAWLTFDSYDEAECASCGWDWRFVYVSVDGGPWVFLDESDVIFDWHRPVMDLTPYLGSNVRIRFHFDAVDDVWNVFLGWVIDDVTIVAADAPLTYCTGKTNSLGCVPFISTVGLPSVSSTTPFRIVANDVGDEVGRLWYSFKKSNLNFHGGKLCIKAPMQRLTHKVPKQTGAPPCEWTLSRNFNARIQSGLDPQLTPGQTVFAQWRGRDPLDPAGFASMLTDGVRFTIAP